MSWMRLLLLAAVASSVAFGQNAAAPSAADLRAKAVALEDGGDYTAAGPLFEQSLAVARKTRGERDRETLEIAIRLSYNYGLRGEQARAKLLGEQVLESSESEFGAADPFTAVVLRQLSEILIQMGDYSGAEAFQMRALRTLEARLGPEAEQVGDALVTAGNSATHAEAPQRAREDFARAAAIYEKRLGAKATKVGGALDDLGQAETQLGRYAEAQATFARALVIQTEALGERHPWTGNVIQGMAKLEIAQGNYGRARDLLERNLSIWRERLGATHPFTLVSTMLMAGVLARMGRYDEAFRTALEAAATRRDNILMTVRTVDERQALRYAGLHEESMDTILSVTARAGASAREATAAWDALIRSRALVLDEMIARSRSIRESRDPKIAALAQTVTAARSQLTRLFLQGPGREGPADYAERLEHSRTDLQRAEEALAVGSTSVRRELDNRRVGYDAVRAALPPGAALVGFRRYRDARFGKAGPPSESYLAFVLAGPDREPTVVPLGDAARMEALIRQWRAAIDRERTALGRAEAANEAAYRTAGAALRDAAWEPVARVLGGAATVYLIPDGGLQMVNFAALPAAHGGYLIESGPLLHVLSTERDLAKSRPAGGPGADLLAVADPQYDAIPAGPAKDPDTRYRGTESSCADFREVRFAPLPRSLEEMRAIVDVWRRSGGHAVTLSGPAATEEAVKEAVAGKRVIHFATHGFFLEAACSGNSVGRENPLLRAGLALAGANRRQGAAADADDGILTAEEVAPLDLENAEWVVLSGCDTGIGDLKAGEGVLGLRRAFQEAGARTLIASLWPVDDRESQAWMTSLYAARFTRKRSTAEAVRDASLERLHARRAAGQSTHPFYWAAFVAVGDWR